MKISVYIHRSLLVINQNGIWNPLHQGNKIDKIGFQQFLYLCLNHGCFPRIHRTQALLNRLSIGISLNLMFNNVRVDTWHFIIRPSEDIMKLFKQLGVFLNVSRGTFCPNIDILYPARITRDIDRNRWRYVFHVPISHQTESLMEPWDYQFSHYEPP